jgi:hypothetical protein
VEKLADGTGALETWPHEVILEIHSLADRFDRDEYIHRLLVAMCFDLSRHLDIVPQLIKDVERHFDFYSFYTWHHFDFYSFYTWRHFDFYSFNFPCTVLSYGPPWAHYLGGYQDRLLSGPLGLPDLCRTVPDGVRRKDYGGEVLG